MNYAVIESGGKQYRVSEGDIIEIDRLSTDGEKISFDKVLLLVDEEHVKIGKPYLNDAKVLAKLIKHKKGEKIRVAKFKSKVRYRRVTGFRANLSEVKIEKIESGKVAPVKTEVKKPVLKKKTQ